MALRTFTAPDGDEWRVWQVIPTPRLHENRTGERRGQDVLAYTGPERREDDRRGVEARFVEPRLAAGWLCFESAREKRRLAPPPSGWDALADDGLAELWSRAQHAPRTVRHVLYPDEAAADEAARTSPAAASV